MQLFDKTWKYVGSMYILVGWNNVVGIETQYGLDGPGIESRWERGFLHMFRLVLWPTQPPAQWVPGLFPGVKLLESGIDHPPASSTEVGERVELYFYFPSGPSWTVLGCTILLVYFIHSGPGSVVGIATAYGLDGPGIESRWGEIFRTSPDWP